jgi:hypothetical protein
VSPRRAHWKGRIAWIAIGLALAGVGSVVAVEALRARLEGSPRLHAAVSRAAEAQLGVILRPGPIEVRFVPPGLLLSGPTLSLPGALPGALPGGVLFELPETRVDSSLADLLARRARFEGLSMSGLFRVVFRSLELTGDLRAELRSGSGPGVIALDAEATLDTGGRIVVDGRLASGRLDGDIRFEDLDGAPFAHLLRSGEGDLEISGVFSGRLVLPTAGSPATVRLESSDAELRLPRFAITGPIALVAELPDETGTRGFTVDASRARVEYAGAVTRAEGRGASVVGRIARARDGSLRLEDVALKIQQFRGELQMDDGVPSEALDVR